MQQQRRLLTEAEIRHSVEQHVLDDRELGMTWDEIMSEDDEVEPADTFSGEPTQREDVTPNAGVKAATGAA